jgi:hypothetical protein
MATTSKGPIRIIRDALDALVKSHVGPTGSLASAVAELDEELGDTEQRAKAEAERRESEKSPEQRAAEKAQAEEAKAIAAEAEAKSTGRRRK